MIAVVECLVGLAFMLCLLTACGLAGCALLAGFALASIVGVVDRLWRRLVRACR